MKRDKAEYVEANDPSFVRQTPNHMLKGFNVVTTKVIRQNDFFPFADHGQTIGVLIDDMIEQALRDKQEINEITIRLSEDDWDALKKHDF